MTGSRVVKVFEADKEIKLQNVEKKTYNYLKTNSLNDIVVIIDDDLQKIANIAKCVTSTVYSSLFQLSKKGLIKIIERRIERKKTKHGDLNTGESGYNYFTVAKMKYGIGKNEIEEIWKKQGYSCAICGKKKESSGKRFHIDHCHISGKIRGLLCSKCNMGIGIFDESIDRLNSAILYLKG